MADVGTWRTTTVVLLSILAIGGLISSGAGVQALLGGTAHLGYRFTRERTEGGTTTTEVASIGLECGDAFCGTLLVLQGIVVAVVAGLGGWRMETREGDRLGLLGGIAGLTVAPPFGTLVAIVALVGLHKLRSGSHAEEE